MSRLCRKCNKQIPNKIKIGGKFKMLNTRKFCLDCSPYLGRNTRSDDPALPATRSGRYKNWSDKYKMIHKARVYRKAIVRKDLLIKLKGGKCQKCGYNKCTRALSFHHRDPDQKNFGLAMNHLWSKSIEEILKEAEKCDLLCMNCHAELEQDKSDKTAIYREIIKQYWPEVFESKLVEPVGHDPTTP